MCIASAFCNQYGGPSKDSPVPGPQPQGNRPKNQSQLYTAFLRNGYFTQDFEERWEKSHSIQAVQQKSLNTPMQASLCSSFPETININKGRIQKWA